MMKPEVDPKLLWDPLIRELVAEGLAMQDRFAAGPVYARTGKGFLKSEGVAGVSSGGEEKAFREFCGSLDTPE
jgi:hypothetical protein